MKALTLVLCILALLGSAASGYFWWSIGTKLEDTKSELAAVQTRADGLQANLSNVNEELETTKTRLAASDAELGDVKTQLTAAEARTVQVARELATTKSTLAEKEADVTQLNTDLDKLRRDLVQARVAAQVGNPEEVERYRETIASLEGRLASLTGVAPAPDADGAASVPAGPVMSERTAAARVATVGTKNAFVVLELGTEDGISPGNKFIISRAGEPIAESVISEVTDNFSIAQVAPSSIKADLKSGDIASYAN